MRDKRMKSRRSVKVRPNEWLARKLLRKACSLIHQAKDLVGKAEYHMPDEAKAFTELQTALQAASDAMRSLIQIATARIDARLNRQNMEELIIEEERAWREVVVYPRSFVRSKAIIYDAESEKVVYKAEPNVIVCDVCNNDMTSEPYIPALVIHNTEGSGYIWGVICPECALKYHADTKLTLIPGFQEAPILNRS